MNNTTEDSKTIGTRIDECLCEGIKRRAQINVNIFLSLIILERKSTDTGWGQISFVWSACVESLYPHMLSNGVYLEKMNSTVRIC